ncbi:MAG: hypothetical protein JRJ85_09510 [Deltaproteobacteria bacterium]|nr:hypothetical protein [Deltaproteobacteria bacterium]
MGDADEVIDIYQKMSKETSGNQIVSALLTCCVMLKKISSILIVSIGHEICMGIRHGLFGANASHNDSIHTPFSEMAEAIERIENELSELHPLMNTMAKAGKGKKNKVKDPQ